MPIKPAKVVKAEDRVNKEKPKIDCKKHKFKSYILDFCPDCEIDKKNKEEYQKVAP